MKEHAFTLILTGIADLDDGVSHALYEAGCDDATPSMRNGVLRLSFDRRARTLKDAVLSVIRDVRKAGVDVLRIELDDPVTQSDIARRIGRSRQVVNQYVKSQRGPGGFPAPVYHVRDKSPLWMWSDVAAWLQRNNLIGGVMHVEDAQQMALINNALEFRRHRNQLDRRLIDEVLKAVGT